MTWKAGTAGIAAAAFAAALGASPALADAPTVATDIPPVHSLVARVMQGLGEPTLVLPPGASPHGYAMRPSEAAALAEADLVVWTGPALTPWLERAVESLAGDAITLELLNAPGTHLMGFREGAAFDPHDHAVGDPDHSGTEAHDHEHAEGEGQNHKLAEGEALDREHTQGQARHGEHAEGNDHDHAGAEDGHSAHHVEDRSHVEPEREQDGHKHAQAGDSHDHSAADSNGAHDHDHTAGDLGEHDHAGVDPHAWLDPQNAKVWLAAIARALADADPENAATYRQNAAAGQAEIDALSTELTADLAGVRDEPFIVFHDAYHYFEHRFGVEAAGAIALADATAPGPARVAAVRQAIAATGAACVFAEPQFPAELIATVTEGSPARAATLDPIGASLPPGPALYPQLLRDLAAALRACLDPAA